MKNLRKKLAGFIALLSIILGGALTSCKDDTEEDENLFVSISCDKVKSDENDKNYLVNISLPTEYADKSDTYIIYTDDGTEPKIDFTDYSQYSTTGNYVSTEYNPVHWWLNGINGKVFTDPITAVEGKVIKAMAYYFDADAGKRKEGTITTFTVKKGESSANSEAEKTAKENAVPTEDTNLTFKFSSSGNTNSVKYFDTANSSVFLYKDQYAYYQVQFSWAGNGKGNWYLYLREVGGSIIPKDDETKYIAKGTYKGNAFDANSKTKIEDGTVELYSGSTKVRDITIETNSDGQKQFNLKIAGVESDSAENASIK